MASHHLPEIENVHILKKGIFISIRTLHIEKMLQFIAVRMFNCLKVFSQELGVVNK